MKDNRILNIRYSIRYLLIAAAIMVLIVISILNFFSYRADHAAKVSGYTQGITIAELNLSNNILKFITRKDLTFANKAKNDINNLKKYVNKLKSAGYAKESLKIMQNIKRMTVLLDKTITSEKRMGLTDKQGIRGKLNNSLKQIENDLNVLNIKTLLIGLLKARVQEKNYIEQGKMEYVSAWNDAMSTLSITIATNADLSENVKERLSNEFKKYMSGFSKYITEYQNVNIAVAKIEEATKKDSAYSLKLYRTVLSKANKNIRIGTILFWIVSILGTILSIIAAFAASNMIVKPFVKPAG
ncbi:MAG TPA: hypothetical protein ENG97_00045, partial [Deltaproteobacteria bacterium]|nr:hypothetical protein [Deltaproteobacteria bacterium]